MSDRRFLRNVTLGTGGDGPVNVLLSGGVMRFVDRAPEGVREVNARGKILLPGLFDLHAHLREPGREDCESMASGSAAAVHGGFTGLLMMPDTIPPIDNGGMVQSLLDTASRQSPIPLHVSGCISRGRAGKELAELGEMHARGALMITDDPEPVENPQLLRRALQYGRDFGLLVGAHCDVRELSGNGVIHDGRVSYSLGLPGIHPCAEEICIARDIRLAQSCNSPIHIKHVTTRQGVDTIRRYRAAGVKVSAEVTPHHLIFDANDIGDYDTNFKVKPPLRTRDDCEALLEGVKDGTIDIIATDHSPCSISGKLRDFASAEFGMIGLETALPALYERLVAPGHLSWPVLCERMAVAPRRLLGLPVPALADGAPVNCVLFDPAGRTPVNAGTIVSHARNTPFFGCELQGRVVMVALDRRILLERD